MVARLEVREAGRAALAALRGGPATVFAAFERSYYVESRSGIACIGGPRLGRGPLNATVSGKLNLPEVGEVLRVNCSRTKLWIPPLPARGLPKFSEKLIPKFPYKPAKPFLAWLAAGAAKPAPRAASGLIGLGPGLTPAGDDFIGGAMIALRAFGEAALADRIAAWALPIAEKATGKISLAHLRCAAQGEGHEALHEMLLALGNSGAVARAISKLSKIGHTSGLDAAAGALCALRSRDSGCAFS